MVIYILLCRTPNINYYKLAIMNHFFLSARLVLTFLVTHWRIWSLVWLLPQHQNIYRSFSDVSKRVFIWYPKPVNDRHISNFLVI